MRFFVSVGTQLPFDRLLEAVEDCLDPTNDVAIFQIGESRHRPKFGDVYNYLSPQEYSEEFDKCDVFISHAGMGSIITALENGKPIIIMPRLFSFGEHRNDHQVDTANRFINNPLVSIVNSKEDLNVLLENFNFSRGSVSSSINPAPELISFLKSVIDN